MIDAIANAFDAGLRQAITAEEYAEVIARNAAETDDQVCHSHDFTDANEIMAAAIAEQGIDLWDTDGTMSDTAVDLWSRAWEVWKGRTA